MSLVRQLKRGKAKIVFLDTLKKFVIYRLTNRGKWMIKDNNSAPQLSKYQMNKLIQQKNG